MPSAAPGLSREEEALVENMRQMSLKHLELLRTRQKQYELNHFRHATNSAADLGYAAPSVSLEDGLKTEAEKNNDSSVLSNQQSKRKPDSEQIEGNHDSSFRLTSSFSNCSKSAEHAFENGSCSINKQNSGLSDTGPTGRTGVMDGSISVKPFAGDGSAIFNRSYERKFPNDLRAFSHRDEHAFLTDWKTHLGEGDSGNGCKIDDPKLPFMNGAGDQRPFRENQSGGSERLGADSLIPISDLDGGSESDVIVIEDSPVSKSLRARNRLAEVSKYPLRKNDADELYNFKSFSSTGNLLGQIIDLETLNEKERDAQRSFGSAVSPQQSSSAEGTPKSILRHRKIIDDNVKVLSKYEHTPVKSKSRTRRGLNFSYTDVGNVDVVGTKSKSVNFSDVVEERGVLHSKPNSGKGTVKAGQRKNFASDTMSQSSVEDVMSEKMTRQPNLIPHYMSSTDGSYIEECDLNENGHEKKSAKRYEVEEVWKDHEIQDGRKSAESFTDKEQHVNHNKVKDLVEKNRLMHSGNDRKHASIVRDLVSRPNSVFAKGTEVRDKQQQSEERILDSSLSKAYMDHPSAKEFSRLMDDRQGKPLLGYDWIAGLLDNETGFVSVEGDNVLEEVKEFRRQNRDECTGASYLVNDVDVGRPITPEIQNPSHTCIHGYSVNERLFTEPVNADAKGTSFCPVCLSTRRDPSQDSPGFVRVSIPRSTLESPYKIKPHRRRSFDPIDSCALSQHCLAGYECSRPSTIATASTLDLKHAAHGIKSQLITTEDEARKIADSVSRTSRLTAPQPLSLPSFVLPQFASETIPGDATLSSQNLSMLSRSSTRDSRSVTDGLLNNSHLMRYQLQTLEKQRGISGQSQPNSTAFPLY